MKAKFIIPTAAELARIRRETAERDGVAPRAERVSYDARKKRIVVELRRGALVSLPLERIPWLRGATAKQLAALHISRYGDAIVSDELDVHIAIGGLMQDLVGLTSAAAMLGSAGGKATSPAKASAARANGKRGGRPRKQPAA